MTVIFNRVLCTPEVRNFVGVSVITFWCFVAFCCLGKHCLDSHPPSHPPANCSLADTQTQNQITKKRRNITKMRACLMLMRDGKMLDLLTVVQLRLLKSPINIGKSHCIEDEKDEIVSQSQY